MQVAAPPWVVAGVAAQLARLHAVQTAPFEQPFRDYVVCMQRCRELEVRLSQLDKEGGELRDENAALNARLVQLEALAAEDWAAQAAEARAMLARMEREVSGLYRDKSSLLEEVVAARGSLSSTGSALESTRAELSAARAEIGVLRVQLAEAAATTDEERRTRVAATSELAAALGARDSALVEAEHLRAEHSILVRRLLEMKEHEAERMSAISKMHEELMDQAVRQRKDAELQEEATTMIRQRAVAAALAAAGGSLLASAAGPGPHQQHQGQHAAAGGGSVMIAPGSLAHQGGGAAGGQGGAEAGAGRALCLKDLMILPSAADQAYQKPPELRQPARLPSRIVPAAHKGGCCSLAAQAPGSLMASCGVDRLVALWDVGVLGGAALAGSGSGGGSTPSAALHGMTSAVNDVGFTCDGAQVVAAGADKSLHVWDAMSCQHRHTMTGHTAAVSGVALSPLDSRLAVSCGEDRCLKLWDLARGYTLRSVPCAKMPIVVACSRDGNTIITGHMDGCVLLWDVRQCRAGAGMPLLEAKDQTQAVVAVAPTGQDSTLVIGSKDGVLRLWDFRGGSTLRVMRHPGFQIGTTGSIGRARCRLGVSPDSRLLAAPAVDGSVWVWPLQGGGGGSGQGGGDQPQQLRGGAAVGSSAHKEAAVAAAFSYDMTCLASADKAGGLAFWPME